MSRQSASAGSVLEAGDGSSQRGQAGEEYLVNSLVRGLELLQHFTRGQPTLSLAELTDRSGLNRTTVYRFVFTLKHLGFLDYEPDTRRYRLGLKVLQLGFEYLNGLPLVDRAAPYLRSLRDEVGESAHLGLLDADRVAYVARVPGERIVSASVRVGARLPAHVTSMGRVLIAYLPADRAEALLARVALEPRTRYSITSMDALRRALETVREQGYAVTNQEYELDVCSVAAPIRGVSGEVVAAINISGPSARLTPDLLRQHHLPAVLRAAAAISHAMGAP